MRIRHLGLPVTDEGRSIAFYAAHFGFAAATAQRFDDGAVIVRSDDFDLAPHPVAEVGPLPEFLHFGSGSPQQPRCAPSAVR